MGEEFEFVPLESDSRARGDFLGYSDSGLCRALPGGWVLGGGYERDGHHAAIRGMELRHDDAWIVSYPKSGTTWTQHMMWLLMNGLDFAAADRVDERSPFVE